MHQARIPCNILSFFYERNRNRNMKNAERAKQPLSLLTSVILNHNCPVLLVRCIHRQKTPVSLSSLRPSLLSSSLIPFSLFVLHYRFLSSSFWNSFSRSPSLSLVTPVPLLSSWATSGAALPPPPSPSSFWWGLNYHNFVLFIPRGKKRG